MTHQPQLIPDQPSPDQAARDAERAEYLERLREKLKDPDFRAIEGFPIGEDEAILALSDPPYYTACPNPFLPEILERWQKEREESRQTSNVTRQTSNVKRHSSSGSDASRMTDDARHLTDEGYHREPFASDVSEGKNDPIYNAHSYHTKVPHKAVMRYILHYTDPGDIVFDGFCGTGMTGVAAQLCGDRKAVEDLGHRVDDDGNIYGDVSSVVRDSSNVIRQTSNVKRQVPFSKLGARKAMLVDLSPAATFIAYNYNTPVDVAAFEREAQRILHEVEEECGWMYETWHPHCDDPLRMKGRINYTVWSDVFVCPQCGEEIVLWNAAVDQETRKVKKTFACPGCGSQRTKRDLERAQETVYDSVLSEVIKQAKRVPVLISYNVGKSRYEKVPDTTDLELLQVIEGQQIPHWFPTRRIDEDIDLWYERDYRSLGIYAVNAFYSKRNLYMTAYLWHRARQVDDVRLRGRLLAWIQSVTMGFSKLNRYLKNAFSQVNRILSGTLYVGSFISEVSPWYALRGKVSRMKHMSSGASAGHAAVSTCSAHVQQIPDNSIDYIFVDPPFGSNIIYSDLSMIWESWLRLFTNPDHEIVVHRRKKSGHKLSDYRYMMSEAFVRMNTVLKPGRWITVEFHNTRNSVWNAIQEAMLRAGFVIADVRTMDKKLATFKQVTTTGAVKQDLIISAYKPRTSFERRFQAQAGTPDGAWDFIRQHLAQLPIVVHSPSPVPTGEGRGGGRALEVVAERQAYLLFDRMVAFHIQRGATVPLSAAQFYAGLRERFVERDGMYFLSDQVPEYDRARLQAAEVAQLTLFVSDEKSAIQWLRQQLDPSTGGQPQTYQELQPQFLRQLHQARHEVLPELSEVLEQNFLQDEAGRWYVPDPGKASDLEKLRRKALLREFAEYTEGRGRLRKFRTEAVRAGFADGWHRRDYATIVKVAERLPERVLQEDPDLLMYYDNATLRVE